MNKFDCDYNVVIAGSGAAALSAALSAARAGLVPLVVEAAGQWGGTTAKSGGGVWVPNNPLMRRAGVGDSAEDALRYLDAVVGEVGPSSSVAKRRAYIDAAPRMFEDFQDEGFKWSYGAHYPDYHSQAPGSRVGRMLESAAFDTNKLGSWRDTMRRRDQLPGVPMYCDEMARVLHASRTRDGFTTLSKLTGRSMAAAFRRQKLASMGMGLVAQLMHLLQRRGIEVWLNSPLKELVFEDGRVVGAVVSRSGQSVRVGASRGVILGAGGFARNDELRSRFNQPTDSKWSIATPEDQGDGLRLGLEAGADVALMADSWWVPVMYPPGTTPNFVVWERATPGSIMVDGAGQRFANEAGCYQDLGVRMLELDKAQNTVPSWLIIDSTHRKRYSFGTALPRITPRKWLESGFMIKSGSLDDLSTQCGIDGAGLRRTVDRFNGFAATGKDEDFGRGEGLYDQYYSDPTHRPNPSLGPLTKPPFYAVRVYPGDVGSKGGLLTNENSCVLRGDGTPISGLYAAGNTSASFMGNRYPGPGSTIGSAVIFGYIAARHIAQSRTKDTAVTGEGVLR